MPQQLTNPLDANLSMKKDYPNQIVAEIKSLRRHGMGFKKIQARLARKGFEFEIATLRNMARRK